jgi:hypothetical protein
MAGVCNVQLDIGYVWISVMKSVFGAHRTNGVLYGVQVGACRYCRFGALGGRLADGDIRRAGGVGWLCGLFGHLLWSLNISGGSGVANIVCGVLRGAGGVFWLIVRTAGTLGVG